MIDLRTKFSYSLNMKKLTKYIILRAGVKYVGYLPGHLRQDEVHRALLQKGEGCQKVLVAQHQMVPA